MYAYFGVYDCFMPGDTIPSNQPDGTAFNIEKEQWRS